MESHAAGKVVALTGNAHLALDGSSTPLEVGSPVFKGGVLITEAESHIEVRFVDDTMLSQGPHSEVSIDDYVYDQSDSASAILLDLTEGTLRTITGKIADENPEGFEVTTPLATLGIRGTDFSVIHTPESGTKVVLNQISENHILIVTDQFENIRYLNDPGTFVTAREFEPITTVEPLSEEEQREVLELTPFSTLPDDASTDDAESPSDQAGEKGASDQEGDQTESEQKETESTTPNLEAVEQDAGAATVAEVKNALEALQSTIAEADGVAESAEVMMALEVLEAAVAEADEEVESEELIDALLVLESTIYATDGASDYTEVLVALQELESTIYQAPAADEQEAMFETLTAEDSDEQLDLEDINNLPAAGAGGAAPEPDSELTGELLDISEINNFPVTEPEADSSTTALTEPDLDQPLDPTDGIDLLKIEAETVASTETVDEPDSNQSLDLADSDDLSATDIGAASEPDSELTSEVLDFEDINNLPATGAGGTPSVPLSESTTDSFDTTLYDPFTSTSSSYDSSVSSDPFASQGSLYEPSSSLYDPVSVTSTTYSSPTSTSSEPVSSSTADQTSATESTTEADSVLVATVQETDTPPLLQDTTQTATPTTSTTSTDSGPATTDTTTTDVIPPADEIPAMDEVVTPTGVTMVAGDSGETLEGGAGNDMLIGGLGMDTFMGGAGDDSIVILGEFDSGAYNDTYGGIDLSAESPPYIPDAEINGGDGYDTLISYGNADYTSVDISLIENIEVHSTVFFTPSDFAGVTRLEGAGDKYHHVIFTTGDAESATIDLTGIVILNIDEISLAEGVTAVIDIETITSLNQTGTDDNSAITAVVLETEDMGSGSITISPDADTTAFIEQFYDDIDDAIKITNVNEPPSAAADPTDQLGQPFATDEDTDLVIEAAELLYNDTDPDSTDTVTITEATGASNGTVHYDESTAQVIYTPDPDWSGTDSFTYTVSDGLATDTATVTVTVNPVNDAPTAAADPTDQFGQPFATDEDTDLVIEATELIDNDTDPDSTDTLTITGASGASNGTVYYDESTAQVIYTPNSNWSGTDSFTYTVSDGLETDTASVDVSVNPVNDAPTAANDPTDQYGQPFATDEDTDLVIEAAELLYNDTDPDSIDTLSITGATGASNGTVYYDENTAQVIYTPDPDWSGTDSFTYTVSDGLETDTASVEVRVNPVNDAPTAANDPTDQYGQPFATDEDTDLVIEAAELLYNDTDPDSTDTLSITGATGASNGTVYYDENTAQVIYTPNSDWSGTDSFTYTVSDGLETDTASVEVRVNPVNDPPTAANDPTDQYGQPFATDEDTDLVIEAAELLYNDTDPDSTDTLAITGATGASNGTVYYDETTAQVIYTPNSDWSGTDSFTYAVSDGLATDTATVEVTVIPVINVLRVVEEEALETSGLITSATPAQVYGGIAVSPFVFDPDATQNWSEGNPDENEGPEDSDYNVPGTNDVAFHSTATGELGAGTWSISGQPALDYLAQLKIDQPLFSQGVELEYGILHGATPSGHDLLQAWAPTVDTPNGAGEIAGRLVFQLYVGPDGDYLFYLHDQIDHPEGGGENSLATPIDFSGILQVEIDGNTYALDPATNSLSFEIVDDAPIASAGSQAINVTLDESDLSSTAGAGDIDLSDGIPGDGTGDEGSGSGTTSIATLFSLGTDENDAESTGLVSYGFVDDVSDLNNLNLTSKGDPVTWTSDGQTLSAMAGGRTVMTVVIDATSGDWTADLDDQFDHVAGGGENTALAGGAIDPASLDLSAYLTATDYDGDIVIGAESGSFTLTFVDDVPDISITQAVGATIIASVEEDGMSKASGDEVGVAWETEGNKEATGDSNTDDEASGAAGSLTTLFTGQYNSIGADEPGTAPTITVSLKTDTSGLDTLYSKGEAVTYGVAQGTDSDILTATSAAGTVFSLTVYRDGSWNFDLDDQLDHVEDGGTEGWQLVGSSATNGGIDFSSVIVGSVTGEDFDQDVATETASLGDNSFVINIQDDLPTLTISGAPLTGDVQEDALGNEAEDPAADDLDAIIGNLDDSGNDTDTATVQLSSLVSYSTGADEPASVAYGLTPLTNQSTSYTSNNTAVTYSTSGNTLTALAGIATVFTFTVDANTGEAVLNLNDRLDHSAAGNDDEVLHIDDLGQYVTVTMEDADGDVISNDFTGLIDIGVENDIAEIYKLGTEFQVNTITPYNQQKPAVASLSNDTYVVVWGDGGAGIKGQIYDSGSNPIGGEFTISSRVYDAWVWKGYPAIAALPNLSESGGGPYADSGFVVVWRSDGEDGDGYGVFGQVLDADGNQVGSEFAVNTTTVSNQYTPSVASLADGTFMVVWTSGDGDTRDVWARMYGDSGPGNEFMVNDAPGALTQAYPSITGLNNDTYFIAWETDGQDAENYAIYGRIYDPVTDQFGPEFQINEFETSYQHTPDVTLLSNDNVIVTWSSDTQDGSGNAAIGRLYSETGSPLTDEFQLNSSTGGNQKYTDVAPLDGGGFVAIWQGDDGGSWGMYGQVFNSSGNKIGEEFQINTSTSLDQKEGAVVALNDGTFVVTWESFHQEIDSRNVYGQHFTIDQPGEEDPANIYLSTTLIDEELPLPLTVATIKGLDPDLGDSETLSYSIVGSNGGTFSIINGNQLTLTDVPGFGLDADAPPFPFDVTIRAIDHTGRFVDKTFEFTVDEFGPKPFGDEFQINSRFVDNQENPSISALADGGFVVVWQSEGQDLSGYASIGQRFDSGGYKVGPEIHINYYSDSDQSNPVVTGLPGGEFVAVWQTANQEGNGFEIYGRIYSAAGVPLTGEFRINDHTLSDQYLPSIAALTDSSSGRFVVSWTSDGQDGDGSGIFVQMFNSDGTKVGTELGANLITTGNQDRSSVTALVLPGEFNGGFTVAWHTTNPDGTSDIWAQSISSDGNYAAGGAIPGIIDVPIDFGQSDFIQSHPSITGLSNGEVLATWTSQVGDGSGYGIYGCFYNTYDGHPSNEFLINTTTDFDQNQPNITAFDGGFIVTWTSKETLGGPADIHGQVFYNDGTRVGNEFTVNSTTIDDQSNSTVSVLNDGSFVVAWQSSGLDGSGTGIYGRRFVIDTPGNDAPQDIYLSSNYVWEDTERQHIGQFTTLDVDNGDTFTYAITGSNGGTFSLMNSTLFLETPLDYETQHSAPLEVTVRVTDRDGLSYEETFDLDLKNLGTWRIGSETQVNSTNDFDQTNPTVAYNYVRSYYIAWQSYQNGSDWDIYAQHFNLDGTPIGDEFKINSTTTNDQINPVIATRAKSSDGFVAVWQETDGASTSLFARIYEGNCNPLTGDLEIIGASPNAAPVVTALSDGGFVVGWSEDNGVTDEIHIRRFDDHGWLVSSDTVASVDTQVPSPRMSISALEDGGYVVAWNDIDPAVDDYLDIFFQRYNPDDTPYGAVIPIHLDVSTGNHSTPTILGLEGGGYAVAWETASESSKDIAMRIYDQDGTPSSEEIIVNTTSGDGLNRVEPVLIDADGLIFVAWEVDGQDGDGLGLFGQAVDPWNGRLVGEELQINTHTDGNQSATALSWAWGGLVAAWESNSTADSDSQGYGISSQRLALDGQWDQGPASIVLSDYFNVNVDEGLGPDTFVADIFSLDPDQGDSVTYTLDGPDAQYFKISGSQLLTAVEFDYESQSGYNFDIIATDQTGISNTWPQFVSVNDVEEILPVQSFTDSTVTNGYTIDSLMIEQLSNGNYLRAWNEQPGDYSSSQLQAMVYDSYGNPITGVPVTLHSSADGFRNASVAALGSNGEFVAVWEGPDDANGGIWTWFGQTFDSNGLSTTDPFVIDNTIENGQSFPLVHAVSSDSFIMAWTTQGSGDDYLQLFSYQGSGETYVADGEPLPIHHSGSALTYLTEIVDYPTDPSYGDSASFLISGSDGVGSTIQLFDSTGNRLGGPFFDAYNQPNAIADQTLLDFITLDSGHSVIFDLDWMDGGSADLRLTILGPDGNLIESTVAHTFATAPDWNAVSLTALSGSDFAVSWYEGELYTSITTSTYHIDPVHGVYVGAPTSLYVEATITSNYAGEVLGVIAGQDGDDLDLAYTIKDAASHPNFSIVGNLLILETPFDSINDAILPELNLTIIATDYGGDYLEKDITVKLADYVTLVQEKGLDQLAPTPTVISSIDDIASFGNGNYAITWSTDDGTGNIEVYVSSFNSGGFELASPFVVNTTSTGIQDQASVTGLSSGNSLVTYRSADTADIFGKIISENGGYPYGDVEIPINTSITGNQEHAVAAALSTGGFVVAWTSDESGNADLRYRIFNENGTEAVEERTANLATDGEQYDVDVAALQNGDFIITWTSEPQPGDETSIHAGIFNSAGDLVTELNVTADAYFDYEAMYNARVTGLSDGGFVIAWDNRGASDTDPWNDTVFFSQYDYDGATATWEFSDELHGGVLKNPVIDSYGDGFVISYDQLYQQDSYGTPAYSVRTIIIDGSGNLVAHGVQPSPNTEIDWGGTDAVSNTSTVQDILTLSNGNFFVVSGNEDLDSGTPANILYEYDLEIMPAALPSGSEFKLNTEISSDQIDPSISTLTDGSLVAVWESYQDGDTGPDIYAGVFNVDGSALASNYQVHTVSSGEQVNPVVTALTNNNYLVLWESEPVAGQRDVFGQIRAKDGTLISAEQIPINTYTNSTQGSPTVAALQAGGFVAVWMSDIQDTNDWGIYAQEFDSSGNQVGVEFLVNSGDTDYAQTNPSVVALENGGYAVSWLSSVDGSNDDTNVYAQVYDRNGAPVNNAILVKSSTGAENPTSTPASIAELSGGNLLIAWNQSNGTDLDVYGKIIDHQSGDTIVDDFLINQETVGEQSDPEISVLQNGQGYFVTAWTSSGNHDGDGAGVFGQVFDRDGNKIGNEFQINTYTTSDQQASVVTSLPDGSLVTAWESNGQDSNGFEVYGQKFYLDMPGTHAPTDIVVGGGLREDLGAGTYYLPIYVLDPDGGGTHLITNVTDPDGTGFFSVIESAGSYELEVTLPADALDYGDKHTFNLTMDVTGVEDGLGQHLRLDIPVFNVFQTSVETRGLVPTINSEIDLNGSPPQTVALADNYYVVVYSSKVSDYNSDLIGKLYHTNNQFISEFTIAQHNPPGFPAADHLYPSIASNDDGTGFMVTWTRDDAVYDGASWSHQYNIFSQDYSFDSASGSITPGPQSIISATSMDITQSIIAEHPASGFITAMKVSDGSGFHDLVIRMLDDTGASTSSDIVVHSYSDNSYKPLSITPYEISGFTDTFLITYQTAANEVSGRFFDGSGAAIGQEFILTGTDVDAYDDLDQGDVEVILDSGHCVVLTYLYVSKGSRLQYALLSPDRTVVDFGDIASSIGTINFESVILLDNNEFLVTWNQYDDASQPITTQNFYSKRFEVDTSLGVTNGAPVDILLHGGTVAENQPGAVVGVLSALDPNFRHHELSYEIVGGSSLFEIDGNVLKLKSGIALDHENQPTPADLDLTLLVTDGVNSFSPASPFTITIADVAEYNELDPVDGTASDDVLQTSLETTPSLIHGNAGDDIIHGSTSGDIIIGGAGVDTIYGYAGDDTFVVWGTFDPYAASPPSGYQGSDIAGDDLEPGNSTPHLSTQSNETIDGGMGEDTIHYYGTVNGMISTDSIEHTVIHSDVTMTAEQLINTDILTITGEGSESHILNITGTGTVDLSGIAIDNIDEINVDPGVELILSAEQEATLPISVVESLDADAQLAESSTEEAGTVEPVFGDDASLTSETGSVAAIDSESTDDEPIFGDTTTSDPVVTSGEAVEPLLADSGDDTAMDLTEWDSGTEEETLVDNGTDEDALWLATQTEEVDAVV